MRFRILVRIIRNEQQTRSAESGCGFRTGFPYAIAAYAGQRPTSYQSIKDSLDVIPPACETIFRCAAHNPSAVAHAQSYRRSGPAVVPDLVDEAQAAR